MRLLSYGRITKARSEGQEIEGGELELLRHVELSSFRASVLECHPYRLGLFAVVISRKYPECQVSPDLI